MIGFNRYDIGKGKPQVVDFLDVLQRLDRGWAPTGPINSSRTLWRPEVTEVRSPPARQRDRAGEVCRRTAEADQRRACADAPIVRQPLGGDLAVWEGQPRGGRDRARVPALRRRQAHPPELRCVHRRGRDHVRPRHPAERCASPLRRLCRLPLCLGPDAPHRFATPTCRPSQLRASAGSTCPRSSRTRSSFAPSPSWLP